jgi:thiol-disulfide isomerase/thioredoxin
MSPFYEEPRKVAGYVIVAVLVGILVVQYVRAVRPSADEDRLSACRALNPMPFNPAIGKLPVPAPNFQAQDYRGNVVDLARDYPGRVVFLNFWQTACEPCKEEVPSMEKMQQLVKGDFVILALASETSFNPVRKFFPRGTNLTVLLDPPDDAHPVGKISRRYGTEKWPETYLIDKKGMVRYYFINQRRWDTTNALECVRQLVAE